ncbi:MAG: hypothetical protein E7047_05530 [Lentisphaerae bacterium]|nr:hypothetical protein [Lentisphaerota bacterium]
MLKKICLLSGVILLTAISGCTTAVSSNEANTIPPVNTDSPGYQACYQLRSERIDGYAQVHVLLGLFAWGSEGFAEHSQLAPWPWGPSAEDFAQSAAVFNACQLHNADSLVGTRYWVVTTDYIIYKCVECKVSGFPAVMEKAIEKKPYIIGQKLFWCAEKPTVLH